VAEATLGFGAIGEALNGIGQTTTEIGNGVQAIDATGQLIDRLAKLALFLMTPRGGVTLAVAVALGLLWLYAHRIEQARLDDHATGKTA
jgi:hypothetical protein